MGDTQQGAGVDQGDSGTATTEPTLGSFIEANQKLAEEADSVADSEAGSENSLDADDQTAESDSEVAATATTELEDDTDGEEISEVDQLLEDTKDDKTPLIRKLRAQLEASNKKGYDLEQRLEGLDTEASKELDPDSLIKGLKSFDLESGEPTAQPFVETLYKSDPELTGRLFDSLSNIKDDKGWTLQHHYLQQNGIDPTRLDEVRDFLNGKVASETGVEVVPDVVPEEYREAFRSLSKVNRDDIVYNLDPDNDNQDAKTAALETLRDRQYRLQQTQQQEQRQQQEQQKEAQEVATAVQTEAQTTYRSLFETLEKSPALEKGRVSADDAVNALVRETFLTQLNALGDPNTMLQERAANFMEAHGIQIDRQEIGRLMNEMEEAFQVKVVATRRNYPSHANDASAIIKENTARLVALGNKYYVAYVKALTAKGKANAEANPLEDNAAPPVLGGVSGGADQGAEDKRPQGQVLNDMASQMARANKQLNQ